MEAAADHLAALPPLRILYTDVDGTLLGPTGSLLAGGDGRPSLRAAAALVAAAEAGLLVVPVSGRRRERLVEDARLLGLPDVIAEAGGVVVRAGEIRYEWGAAPRGVAATPHDTLVATGAIDVLLERFAGRLRLYEPWHAGREAGALLHGEIDVAAANGVLSDAGLGWAHVVDNGRTGGWSGRVVRAYHLLPRGVGKGPAVADDLASRGLDPRAAAAIGDSLEDATMARHVATYFRVANGHAHPDVADFTTPSPMGDGFADAVDVLLRPRR